jgi:hypothetical protein
MYNSFLSLQRLADTVRAVSFLRRLDGLRPAAAWHGPPLFVLVGLIYFSLLSSQRPSDTVHSASLGRLGHLRLAKGLFSFLRCLDGLYLSIQPPPDTVHTWWILMVALTFLYSPRRGRPIRYTLQVLADQAVFASLEGFTFLCRLDGLCTPLHPAAAWHGTHFWSWHLYSSSFYSSPTHFIFYPENLQFILVIYFGIYFGNLFW